VIRLACVLLLVPGAAWAQPRAGQADIDALLAAIESSGCQFERNGTRHDAREGAAHLRMKLDRAGTRVQTAREFIERIAAGSSQSGRPYLVLCPDQPPQRARDWLEERLHAGEKTPR
jgi:hypothetical protein